MKSGEDEWGMGEEGREKEGSPGYHRKVPYENRFQPSPSLRPVRSYSPALSLQVYSPLFIDNDSSIRRINENE